MEIPKSYTLGAMVTRNDSRFRFYLSWDGKRSGWERKLKDGVTEEQVFDGVVKSIEQKLAEGWTI